ncbi:universal stress protein [Streptomyces althioticus]|uniref:universal stress protein n=1 Tax=Streptomyces althioticus TaxID=83380 RepID=UPI0033C3EBF4
MAPHPGRDGVQSATSTPVKRAQPTSSPTADLVQGDAVRQPIVAGVDGTSDSLLAAGWAAAEARRCKAPLVLLHGYAPLAGTSRFPPVTPTSTPRRPETARRRPVVMIRGGMSSSCSKASRHARSAPGVSAAGAGGCGCRRCCGDAACACSRVRWGVVVGGAGAGWGGFGVG